MKQKIIYFILLVISFGIYASESLTASYYLDQISQFDKNMENINLERANTITKAKESLNADMISEKNNIDNIKPTFTETQQQLKDRKANLYKELESEYKTNEANKIAEINNKYNSLIQQEKQKKEALINEMLNKEFLVSYPDVKISVGDFKVEADPQHFPVSVISEKTELDYKYTGQILLEEADRDAEGERINSEKDNYKAEIIYKIEQQQNKFIKKITKIIIKNDKNAVIRRFIPNEYENKQGFTIQPTPQPTTQTEKTQITSNTTTTKPVQKIEPAKTITPKPAPKTKQVWVDDGLSIGGILSLTLGIPLGVGGGLAMMIPGICGDYTGLMIAGGITLGLSTVLVILSPLMRDGHYETRVIGKVNSDPVLKNVKFETTGHSTTLGYKFNW